MALWDRTFRTIPTREGRVTAGLSMGGYGALKLALKHPDLFCAAVSHSGAVDVGRRDFSGEDDWAREWRPIFGAKPEGGMDDLFALAPSLDLANIPALRIDCGVDDFLIEDNRKFDAHLTALGVAHEYAEHAGQHDWNYWNRHILDTLAFFGGVLGYDFKPKEHI